MRKTTPLEFYSTPLPGVDYSELQGKLIVIEGPDSVGRSTQVTRLRVWLEQHGHELKTYDPGVESTAATLEELLLSATETRIDAELTRNIIGTIGEVDTYRLPDAKGFTAMQRYLIGDISAT